MPRRNKHHPEGSKKWRQQDSSSTNSSMDDKRNFPSSNGRNSKPFRKVRFNPYPVHSYIRPSVERPYRRTKRQPADLNGKHAKLFQSLTATVKAAAEVAGVHPESVMENMAKGGPVNSDIASTEMKTVDSVESTQSILPLESICLNSRVRHVLAQVYADINAASTPGVIQATNNIEQLIVYEDWDVSPEKWIQSNLALRTRTMLKVIGKKSAPLPFVFASAADV